MRCARVIVRSLLCTCLIGSSVPAPAFAQGNGNGRMRRHAGRVPHKKMLSEAELNDLQGFSGPAVTGLEELSDAEIQRQRRNTRRVEKVHLNKLGYQRLMNADARGKLGRGKQLKLGRLKKRDFFLRKDLELEIDNQPAPEQVPLPADILADPVVLPGQLDNSTLKFFPPVRSQGSLGSCGVFSGTYYAMTYMWALANDIDAKNGTDADRLSPQWSYNFVNNGGTGGSWYYWAYQIAQKHGCATWEMFPYDLDYRKWPTTSDIYLDAMRKKCETYGYVANTHTDEGMEQVKQLLLNGYVLNYATYIYSWQYKQIADDPSTTDDDAYVGSWICYFKNGYSGYHAMTVVGYDDNIWVDINDNGTVDTGEKGAFRICNSWGSGWREGGYTWIAYDALRTVSAVPGGPSENRVPCWSPTSAYWVIMAEGYEPKLAAEFTLNHLERNQLNTLLGVSTTSNAVPSATWYPSSWLSYSGGPYAFDGGTAAVDAVFAYDFTDLVNSEGIGVDQPMNWYINTYDNATLGAADVKAFRLVDIQGGGYSTYSNDLPVTVDNGNVYAHVQYALSGGETDSVVRINAAGDGYVDITGSVWDADRGFSGGLTVDRGAIEVANTDDDYIYQTERYSMSSYDVAVPNGSYLVNLHFAETYSGITAAGQRVFDVLVEDVLIDDLDVYAESGGFRRALVKTVRVTVADGLVNIVFTAGIQNPLINGIEIVPLHDVRVISAATTPYVDIAGNEWSADFGFSGGLTVDRGAVEIANTDDDRIYQTERYNMSNYSIDVPNGDYVVNLHFAETWSGITAAGQRVFDVQVEDVVFAGLDVFAEAGGFRRALVKTAAVTVNDGRVDIVFTANIQNPMINGIEILGAGQPRLSLYCSIEANGDDVYEFANGAMNADDAYVSLGANITALRYRLDIPAGATINAADVQFSSYWQHNNGPVSVSVCAEDTDHAAPFAFTSYDVSQRIYTELSQGYRGGYKGTTATVAWDIPDWVTNGYRTEAQKTPDIASVIQEVVDRPGWQSGNYLVIVFTHDEFGSTGLRAVSHDHDPAESAVLHVEFTTNQ